MKKSFLVAVGLLPFSVTAASLPDVVITAKRIESSYQKETADLVVIDRTQIEALGRTSVTEVLATLSGIQISDNGYQPVVNARGVSGASNVLILVDGQKLNQADIAAPMLNQIDVRNIERIEVLFGNIGSLYGDQAVGAVVQIFTRGKKQSEVQVTADSYGSFGVAGTLSYPLEDHSLSLAVQSKEGRKERDHTNYLQQGLSAELDLALANGDLSLSYQHHFSDQELAGSLSELEAEEQPTLSRPEFVNDYLKVERQDWGISGDFVLSEWIDGQGELHYFDEQIESIVSYYGSSPSTTVGEIQKSGVEFTPRLVQTLDEVTGKILITGVDARITDLDYDLPYTVRSNRQTLTEAYAQLQYPFSATLELSVGGRYGWVQDELTDLTMYPDGETMTNSASALDIGIDYRVSDSVSVTVSAGSHYRFAKIDEQAFTALDVQGLEPQTGSTISASLLLSDADYRTQVTAYRLRLDDEIFYDPTIPNGPWGPGANANGEQSERIGLSVQSSRQMNDQLLLSLGYDYLDAKYIAGSNDGKTIPWVSENTVTALLNWQASDQLSLTYDTRYESEKYRSGDSGNTMEKIDAVWVSNLSANQDYDNWSIGLTVNNLFDEQYAGSVYYSGYYPAPGRHYVLTADYRF